MIGLKSSFIPIILSERRIKRVKPLMGNANQNISREIFMKVPYVS